MQADNNVEDKWTTIRIKKSTANKLKDRFDSQNDCYWKLLESILEEH